ncbi:RNA polymerase sigma factor [Phycicoccus flavus]|uniref:Sigma-70 family RNA polymerase sigma factor n=1 Tax=Phycicoccus flavus TaxID=2502783 RepID=A0A8T6R656_9MICO|nr:sigma-70 family RNA polymerase sigma factor [Phycicoccus flavus]NHA67711.1 sigma-70 family RNA polymerase sigma factor [Phycicoccus flavus]
MTTAPTRPAAPVLEPGTPAPTEEAPDLSTLDTAALVARCREGEQAAWTALTDRFGRLVHSIARRHRLSAAECDDVAQATWLRLVQRIDSIRTPESCGDWLATVARNESLRIITRERRATPMADPAGDTAASSSPHDDPLVRVLRDEELRTVADALASLEPRHRELLRLVLLDPPLSYAEIGELLGMPAASVGPTRTRCLRRLQRAIEERSVTEDRLVG